jgi:hypothetical protein
VTVYAAYALGGTDHSFNCTVYAASALGRPVYAARTFGQPDRSFDVTVYGVGRAVHSNFDPTSIAESKLRQNQCRAGCNVVKVDSIN